MRTGFVPGMQIALRQSLTDWELSLADAHFGGVPVQIEIECITTSFELDVDFRFELVR